VHTRTETRRARRDQLIALLGGSCVVCGCGGRLEFDHVDPKTMAFRISGGRLDKPWPALVAEARKCQLLCPPHHREKTARERGFRRYDHGTRSSYIYGGCRCPACRAANTAFHADYVARRRANGGPLTQPQLAL
jgi:hypothetical protein